MTHKKYSMRCLVLPVFFLFLLVGCEKNTENSRNSKKLSTFSRATTEWSNETGFKVIDTGLWILPEVNSLHWLDNDTAVFTSYKDGRHKFRNRNDVDKQEPLVLVQYNLKTGSFELFNVEDVDNDSTLQLDCVDSEKAVFRIDRVFHQGEISLNNNNYTIINPIRLPEGFRWSNIKYNCDLVPTPKSSEDKKRARFIPQVNATITGYDYAGKTELIFDSGISSNLSIGIYDLAQFSYVPFLRKISFISRVQEPISDPVSIDSKGLHKFQYLISEEGSIERIPFYGEWDVRKSTVIHFNWTVKGPVGWSDDNRVENRSVNDQGLFYFETKKEPKMIIRGWIKDVAVSPDGCRVGVNHVVDLKNSGNVEDNQRTLKIVQICDKEK